MINHRKANTYDGLATCCQTNTNRVNWAREQTAIKAQYVTRPQSMHVRKKKTLGIGRRAFNAGALNVMALCVPRPFSGNNAS